MRITFANPLPNDFENIRYFSAALNQWNTQLDQEMIESISIGSALIPVFGQKDILGVSR